jgi:hypothetical protein
LNYASSVLRFASLLTVVFFLCGCEARNPDYCCTTLEDCAFDELPLCAQGLMCVGHECVEPTGTCASSSDCLDPQAPICGEDSTCHACVLDDECTTGVCLADGRCGSAENVIYATPEGATTGTCEIEAPCELSYARSQIRPTRSAIVLAGGTYSLSTAFRVDSSVGTLLVVGPRLAVIEHPSTGSAFEVVGGADLTVRGITIHKGLSCDSSSVTLSRVLFDEGGTEVLPRVSSDNCVATISDCELRNSPGIGLSGHGLDVQRTLIADGASIAIRASAGFSMTRSVLVRNRGGGAWVTGSATITNNFIGPENGTEKTTNPSFGGLLLDSVSGTVEHNTIYFNHADPFASPLYAGGVYCTAATAIPNNLIVQNSSGSMTMPNANIGGNCVTTGSIVSSEPFTFAGGDDLHLPGSSSPAVDAGALGTVTEDIDGEPRSDGAPDMGADEYMPGP